MPIAVRIVDLFEIKRSQANSVPSLEISDSLYENHDLFGTISAFAAVIFIATHHLSPHP